jgi:excisionase family DNA binding protein
MTTRSTGQKQKPKDDGRSFAADDQPGELTPVTVKEAAGILGRNTKTIYDAIARGEIPAIRIGHLVLIPRPAFERLLRGGSEAA